MNQKFKVLTAALVIFVGGAVCGGFGAASVSIGMPSGHGPDGDFHERGGKWMKDPKKFAARIQEKLEKKLELTDDQSKKLSEILSRAANEAEAKHEQARAERHAKREEISKEIEAILDANQKEKFTEMKKELDQRRGKFRQRLLERRG